MTAEGRRKVLVSAYACEPGASSEPGVGWNWAVQIARFHEAWVITRANNGPAIEEALEREGISHLHPVYFDLKRWARFWKKGRRGMRLYYVLWQIGAWLVARRLHRRIGFDLAHHLTFVSYWLPIGIALLPVPLVLGPAGGGESFPRAFRRSLGWRGRLYEASRAAGRRLGEIGLFARVAVSRAGLAMAATPETAARLARLGFGRPLVVSQMGIGGRELALLGSATPRDRSPFRAASIGRLLHWKGFALGLKAFARFSESCRCSQYWIIGDGPERARLERLARELGVEDRVRFFGALPRDEALARLLECDALLHPSLHDSGGWVCLEAMAARRPVVCLDLGGPGLLVSEETGCRVRALSGEQVVQDMAEALRGLAADAGLRRAKGEAARALVVESFQWDGKGVFLRDRYNEVMRA